MRPAILVFALMLASCGSGISSVPLSSGGPSRPSGALGYMLPKGLVPFEVFLEKDSVGISVQPATIVGDTALGPLIAQIRLAPSNNEDFKLAVDPNTSLLTSVGSDSEAKIEAILEEAAKSAARIALQNAPEQDGADKKFVLLRDNFDPLSPSDIRRAEAAMRVAVGRGMQFFRGQAVPQVSLTVMTSDGTAVRSSAEPAPALDICRVGLCTRVMTSRTVLISLNGAPLGSMVVAIPSTEIIAIQVPQTILANQKIAITLNRGILSGYNIERDSELMGLVKLPGAILSGAVAGITQGLSDRKSISEKTKEVADAQKAASEATDRRRQSLTGQNADGAPTLNGYSASTLTVFPFISNMAARLRGTASIPSDNRPPSGPPAN